jgi:hypothetical protein
MIDIFTYFLGIILFFIGTLLAIITIVARAKYKPSEFTDDSLVFGIALGVLLVYFFGYDLLDTLTYHVTAEGGILSDRKWLLFDFVLFFVLGISIVFVWSLIPSNFVPFLKKHFSSNQIIGMAISMFIILIADYINKNKIPKIDFSDTTYIKLEGFKPKQYSLYALPYFYSNERSCTFKFSDKLRLKAQENHSYYSLPLPLSVQQGGCRFFLSGFSIELHHKRVFDFRALIKAFFSSPKVKDVNNIYLGNVDLLQDKKYKSDDFEELDIYCQRYITRRNPLQSDVICHSVQKKFIIDTSFSYEFISKKPIKINILLSKDLKLEAMQNIPTIDTDNKNIKISAFVEEMLKDINITQNTESSIEEMIEGEDQEATTHIIHTKFMPSKKLFEAYLKKNSIDLPSMMNTSNQPKRIFLDLNNTTVSRSNHGMQ